MSTDAQAPRRSVLLAASGLTMLVHVAGKTVRDTLFWAAFDQAARPVLTAIAALVSFPIVALSVRAFSHKGATRVLPTLFGASAILLVLEMVAQALGFKAIVACAVWIHLAAVGPVLLSGWWGAAVRQFDPRSARKEIGALAAASTAGALIGGIACTLLPLAVLLGIFAVAHAWCGYVGLRLAATEQASNNTPSLPKRTPDLLTVIKAPFLRRLGLVVLLASVAGGLLEHVFQTTMNAHFGVGAPGGSVRRLQEVLSTVGVLVTGLTLLLQVTVSRSAIASWGVIRSVVLLPISVTIFALCALFSPATIGLLIPVGLARVVENTARNSFFRPGLELLFGAISSDEQRAAKTVIDTSVDRTGDLIVSTLIASALVFLPHAVMPALLVMVVLVSFAASLLGPRLHGGYSTELETTLRQDAGAMETAALTGQVSLADRSIVRLMERPDWSRAAPTSDMTLVDVAVRDDWLQSGDIHSVRRALLSAPLPQDWDQNLLPLLAREDLKNDLIRALRATLPGSAPRLGEALLDPRLDALARRRIPPILSSSPSPEARDALLRGLTDNSFEIRERCARGLLRLRRRDFKLPIDHEAIMKVLQREIDVERDVWEARNLLDSDDMGQEMHEIVEARSDRSLKHVFVLLEVLFPETPTDIILAGLRSGGRLRGTALEYLETILPEQMRRRLKALLDVHEPSARRGRQAGEIVADLLSEHQSMVIQIERKRSG